MTTGSYNESDYENAVIEVLRSMKWEYMYGPDIERDYSDPTLPDVFEYQVRKLIKSVSDEAVNDAIRQVRGIAGGSVVVRNAIFTDWLQNGVNGACRVAGDDTTRLVHLFKQEIQAKMNQLCPGYSITEIDFSPYDKIHFTRGN